MKINKSLYPARAILLRCVSSPLFCLLAVTAVASPAADLNQVNCVFAPHLTCRDSHSGEILWRDTGYSDPDNFALVQSRLYISHSTTSSAYNAITGEQVWKVASNTDAHYFYPLVADNSVYLARTDGVLEKRRIDSGNIIWSRSLADGWVYPPLIQRDSIITGGRDRTIWILDSQSGETRNIIKLDQELVAPLFQAKDIIIASTFDGQLSAYRLDRETNEPEAVWRAMLSAPAFSYLADSRYLITADMGGILSSVDPETGHILWQKIVHRNALFWNVFYGKSLISLTESGSLNILDTDSGRLRNALQLDHRYLQAPIVHGETIALYDINGAVQYIAPDTLETRLALPHLTSTQRGIQ